MPGIVFDAIDRHVIAGRGEEIAALGSETAMTYIELLTHISALGGGLRRLGAVDESSIGVDGVPDWDRLSLVLALARLGLTPDRESSVRVVGDPPLLLLGEESLSLETVLKIGRLDPVPAPSFDDSHLLGQLTPKERDWISGLTRGELITLN